jgi:acetyl-CoA carboxylase biotin carboxyl carrier protein
MNLSNEDVQDILRVLDSTSYDELRLETARFRMVLRRSAGGAWTQETQALSTPRRSESADRAVEKALSGGAGGGRESTASTAAHPPSASGAQREAKRSSAHETGAAREPAAASEAGDSRHDLHEVRPPMLGTFYRAPKPGAAPFVEVGSKVRPDTVVCIIETMKLMNSVCAGVAGEVAEICLDDAQFADESAVLLRIRPEPTCA